MKMKRTITLMILAGLLTASLSACVVKPDDEPDNSGSGGSEPYFEQPTTPDGTVSQTPPTQTTDPSAIVYTPANETVYTINNASLKPVANPNDPAAAVTLGQMTEMTRTGVHTVWSKVNYMGQEYYVATALLTTDDIAQKTFTAVSKNLYVNTGSLYIRALPSAESFSEKIGSLTLDTLVTVIAQNATWSKIQWTEGGTTKTGFVNSKYLSTTKSSVVETDYINQFTTIAAKTMYVSSSFANLRMHPYADERGTLVVAEGLVQGTAVRVIGEGTVENVAWYAVEYEVNSVKHTYYIAKKALSGVSSATATLEDMLAQYPDLKKFDADKTLYVYEDNANGRSAPTRLVVDGKTNVVKSLVKGNTVVAVASGKIAGQDPNGNAESISWCLVKDTEKGGFYFVSLGVLTSDPNLKPSVPALTLNELIAAYGFQKPTSGTITMKAISDIKPWSAPDGNKQMDNVTIAQGTTVTVVATGSTTSGLTTNKWYIIEYNGAHYFVIQSLLEIA